MPKAKPLGSRRDTYKDVGTLWLMRRNGRSARCALMSSPGTLELRVLVDGQCLLIEQCDEAAEAFTLAEAWKCRMRDKGWLQVLPASASLTS